MCIVLYMSEELTLPTGYATHIYTYITPNRGKLLGRADLLDPDGEMVVTIPAKAHDDGVHLTESQTEYLEASARADLERRSHPVTDPATEDQVATIMRLLGRRGDEPMSITPPRNITDVRAMSRTDASEYINYLKWGD